MRLLRSISAFSAVLALGSFAHADSFATYNFSDVNLLMNKGASKIYGVVDGSVTIDLTTGSTFSGDFTVDSGATTLGGSNPDTYVFTTIKTPDKTGTTGYIDTVFETTGDTMEFDLEYILSGTDVTLCATGGACDFPGKPTEQTHLDSTPNLDLVSGSFVAATPEPSSLLLLGTGLLGVAGSIVRRRSA